jgi:hypothetical protein
MPRYHFAPQQGSNNFFNIGITCFNVCAQLAAFVRYFVCLAPRAAYPLVNARRDAGRIAGPLKIGRRLKVPRRKRTRAADRHYRIASEQRINEDRLGQQRLAEQRSTTPGRLRATALLTDQPGLDAAQRLFDITCRPGEGQADERAAVNGVEVDARRNRNAGVGQQF